MCKKNLANRGSAFSLIIKSKWLAKRAKMYKIYEDTRCYVLSTQSHSYRLLFSGFTLMVTLLLRAEASFSMLLWRSLFGSEFVVSLLDVAAFS